MKKIINITTAALAGAILLATPAFSADEYNVSSGVTMVGKPLGVHGVDTVALAGGKDMPYGSASFTSIHDGVSYYFASKETQSRFEAAPEKYLPQFGGFCALAVGLGKKFDGNPRFADIVDGKLYVFVNEAVFGKYQEDKSGTLAKSEAAWKNIKHTPISEL